jgi:acyl-coenzyme A synthetase/AMP-(fatty) acid ligase
LAAANRGGLFIHAVGVLCCVVCALQANYLRSVGVKKGDAVSIYMPMVCELPIAMLACARIGAVHSVVFGGFSAEALAGGPRMGSRTACIMLSFA